MKAHILFVALGTFCIWLFVGGKPLYIGVAVTLLYFGWQLIWHWFEFLIRKVSTRPPALEGMLKQMASPAFKRGQAIANDVGHAWPQWPKGQVLLRSQVKSLHIVIASSPEGPDWFRIQVSNKGRKEFRNLRIDLKNILLWAENFGLDTTHMPADMQYAEAPAVLLRRLPGRQSLYVQMRGYSSADRYDRPRTRYAPIAFEQPRTKYPDLHPWCDVTVDLQGARQE